MEGNLSRKFYVYTHSNDTNGVFYVGKGSGNRAHSRVGRNRIWVSRQKNGLDINITHRDLLEECSFCIEKILISLIGRKNLSNMTDGGEGTSGWVPSDEFRKNLSKIRKGIKPHPNARTPEAINKRIMKLKGRRHSSKHKKKISNSLIGKTRGGKIYKFYHVEHGTVETTCGVLKSSYNLDGNVNGLASGRVKSTKGWSLYENRNITGLPTQERHHNADLNKYTFVHETNGKFCGSRYEFSKKYNLCLQGIGKIVRKDRPSYKGWRLV